MEAIERTFVNLDWITLVLIFSISILVIARQNYPTRFQEFVLLFATNKYMMLQGKDPNIFHPFNIMFFTINVISVSLFAFLYWSTSFSLEKSPFIVFLQIATAYTTLILVKFSVEKIISDIFSINNLIDLYLFHKLSYRNFIAFFLLPFNLIFIYAATPSQQILLWILGIILFLNIVVVIGFYLKNRNQILSRWFYFIVYLCALEIAPYYILFKWITDI